jgi:tRNA A-37 threonylcarbamoyl transferase component Bud32
MGRRGNHEHNARVADDAAGVASEVWEQLGGYRLLRAVGHGRTATAYLAAGDEGQVVVKVCRDIADSAAVRHEVAALASIASPHVVELLDVASSADRPTCLVLERIAGPSLSDWLRSRTIVEVGECVTVCVSVVRAVRAVHAAGWAHGDVAAASIRFDEGGCPVLLGFGSVGPATPSTLADDWRGCQVLVEALVRRAVDCAAADAERVGAAVNRLATLADSAEYAAAADLVESALFDLGPAGPVSLHTGVRDPLASNQTRTALSPAQFADDAGGGEPDVPVRSPRRNVIEIAAAIMEHGLSETVRTRLSAILTRRRRPIVIGVVAAAALTMVALLTIPESPAGQAEAGTGATPSGRITPTTMDARTPRPTHAPSAPAPSSSPGPSDPVRAVARLLQRRHDCIVDGEPSCLDDSDQAGSPLYEADAALIAGAQEPPAVPEESQLSLLESMGDAAVIAVAPSDPKTAKPASILAIRTEAGWRLRSAFED